MQYKALLLHTAGLAAAVSFGPKDIPGLENQVSAVRDDLHEALLSARADAASALHPTDEEELGSLKWLKKISDPTVEALAQYVPDIRSFISSLETAPREGSYNAMQSQWAAHTTSKSLPKYGLRSKPVPETLGVDKVKQHSGYLDTAEDKHFFYWFFESRGNPATDPVVLWLTGGPGCSSMTGLFFELGPSSVNKEGKLVNNEFSWNNNHNVIFLDQPASTGLSYGGNVDTTIGASKDVYAFLTLFFKNFPEYAQQDFHIAGESYAGRYIPVFASDIVAHQNGTAERYHKSGDAEASKDKDVLPHINLKSVMIGNGLIDPLRQYPQYKPMACGEGGFPSVLTKSQCSTMAWNAPFCQKLIQACYNGYTGTCVESALFCNSALLGPYQRTGLNVYDIRVQCGDNPLCYDELDWIEEFMNRPSTLAALGAEVDKFESCNRDVNKKFVLAGDWMVPYQTRVTQLLDAGIRVLVYAGEADFICNWLGSQAFVNDVPYSDHEQMAAADMQPWLLTKSIGKAPKGKHVGNYKTAGNLTFIQGYGAGHMMPYNQPESALDMLEHWISGSGDFGSGHKGKHGHGHEDKKPGHGRNGDL